MTAVPHAFNGLRVLELATGISGPYCGKLFAGLGADVVKIEAPGGDRSRYAGPFPGDMLDPERSGLFLHLNTGKRSLLLDLDHASGRGELERLLPDADILLLDCRPGELAALQLDLGVLRERFPGLIIVDVTTFGLSGPYAGYLGGELIAYALSGYMMLTGSPERPPIKSYGALVEYEAGAQAALGAVAALLARERDGLGQVVDVSAMEAGTFMLGGVEQSAHFFGRIVRRNGTRLLGFAPEHSYPSTIRPCRDGYVHCHSNNRYLDLLAALIPDPRLLEPDLLSTMMGHADEIDAIMDTWLADKDRREVVQRAQELRLPFTEVLQPGEVMAEQHHRERGSFVTIEHLAAGPLLQPGAPFRLGRTPWQPAPAPLLGQHTDALLAEARRAPEAGRVSSHQKPAQPAARPAKPLHGVRVIDFTNAVAGPIASFLLADLGAEVIKVEAPNSRPLHAAGTAPLREGGEDRSYDRVMLFNELNHGKRSLVLDVATAAGRELFLRLVEQSDIVIENFAPRVMPNLGIDYEKLRRVRPEIIMTSMPAFGLSGPYQDRISYGPGIDAMSGLSHLTGYADEPPMKPGNFFCDQNAGVHSAFATLAALRHRNRTGEGQHIELAMIDGEFQVLGDAYIDYVMNGRERFRSGNDQPGMAPHDVFPCQGDDAWVAIAVENDAQWQALCSVIGKPGLAADPRFAGAASRYEHRGELQPIIAQWTRNRTHYMAQAALQAAGVPAGAVLNAVELLSDPHVRARHGFEYVDVPNVGPTPYPRAAFMLSRTPVPIDKPAPGFGMDNDYVLEELLGLSDAEVSRLRQAGVTASVPLSTVP